MRSSLSPISASTDARKRWIGSLSPIILTRPPGHPQTATVRLTGALSPMMMTGDQVQVRPFFGILRGFRPKSVGVVDRRWGVTLSLDARYPKIKDCRPCSSATIRTALRRRTATGTSAAWPFQATPTRSGARTAGSANAGAAIFPHVQAAPPTPLPLADI